MTDNEKIELLKRVLKDNGLNYDDPEINDFFTEKRASSETLTEYDKRIGEEIKYFHSSKIKPAMRKVTPMEIDNASYAEWHNLSTVLDWYLYKNAGDNPLVFENIGKDSESLLKSFIDERKNSPLVEDLKGMLFNNGDGNHRLLALIINNFIEFSKAKTDEERQAVDDKFTMEIAVDLPHKEMLCDALRDEYRKVSDYLTKDNERLYPRAACAYREDSFAKAHEREYLVEYDEKTKKYSYEFNSEKFVGTDDELIGWLSIKEKTTEPIMKWCAGGVYYLSCENQLWKSANKQEIENKYEKVREQFKAGKIQKNKFLEVKDLDSNTYEFQYNGMLEDFSGIGVEVADFWHFVLKGRPEKVLFHKLKDSEFIEENFRQKVHDTRYLNNSFSMSDFKYENLTHDEYVNVKKLFETFEQKMALLKNDPVEV